MNNFINRYDNILQGITFDDLITTLQSNEKTIDKQTVLKVYNEILKLQMDDALFLLNDNMKFILKEAKEC